MDTTAWINDPYDTYLLKRWKRLIMDNSQFLKYCDEQIPGRLKTDRYLTFQNLIRKRNITSLEEFQEYIDNREIALNDFLKNNQTGGTIATHLREKAEELGMLQMIKRNFIKYL